MPGTPAKAGKAMVDANKGTLFELNDVELDSLKSTRGRKATPSVYLDEVAAARAAAVDGGESQTVGIRLSATVKAPWVQAQLRKAGKELGCDKQMTIYNREEKGFVAFVIKPE